MPLKQETTYTLNTRLKYQGGYQNGRFISNGNAESRFINDKLIGLKRALLYSYQACTLQLDDGREFRCLMNPNKLKPDYDNKILSIPFRDVQLNPELVSLDENGNPIRTSDGLEDINIKCGDIFTWKETKSKWLVYLRHVEEDAYFRAEVRRCDQKWRLRNKPNTGGWCYIRGPVETSVQWSQKAGVEQSALNYSLVMYVPKTKENLENIRRFTKIDVQEPRCIQANDQINPHRKWRPWYVAAVDPYYGDGVIEVMLDEDHMNHIDAAVQREHERNPIDLGIDESTEINGKVSVNGYTTEVYTIDAEYWREGGEWYTDLPEVTIVSTDYLTVKIEIGTGKAGEFKLYYKPNKMNKDTFYYKTIKILPF